MRPYDELTHLGRLRRMRQLARLALEAYGLGGARFRLIAHAGNTLYRVFTEDRGQAPRRDDLFEEGQLLLRVHWPGYQATDAIRLELAWLSAMRRERDLPVPEPVPTLSGDLLSRVSAEGVPETRDCSLLRWVKGRRVSVGVRGSKRCSRRLRALV